MNLVLELRKLLPKIGHGLLERGLNISTTTEIGVVGLLKKHTLLGLK